MKILILDDDNIRHEWYAEHYKGHDVFHVYSKRLFCKTLSERGPFELIHFDHDLGGGGNGFDAALFLTGQVPQEQWPAKCIVHSWNPTGARRIVDVLERNGMSVEYSPFAQR